MLLFLIMIIPCTCLSAVRFVGGFTLSGGYWVHYYSILGEDFQDLYPIGEVKKQKFTKNSDGNSESYCKICEIRYNIIVRIIREDII